MKFLDSEGYCKGVKINSKYLTTGQENSDLVIVLSNEHVPGEIYGYAYPCQSKIII